MPISKIQRDLMLSEIKRKVKDLRMLEKSSVKDVSKFLIRLRNDLTTTLKETERFSMPYYRSLIGELNSKIDSYMGRLNTTVTTSQKSAFDIGETLTDNVAKTAEIYGLVKLSDELIVTAQNFTTDLITDMSDEMKQDIASSLRKSLLTGESNFTSARKLDKIIGANKNLGYFNRSDKIARTEIGRAFSIARQAKDEETAERLPNYKKQWQTAEDSRVRDKDMGGGRGIISHVQADGQIRKVDEPFDVGGEKAMFPRDPSLSPANSINCRCISIPYLE